MTSANVTNYSIYKNNAKIAEHSQHHYCMTSWEELLKYQPLTDYLVVENWLDEEEGYHELPAINLRRFLLDKNAIPRLESDPPEFVKVYLFDDLVDVRNCCDGEFERHVLTISNPNHPLSGVSPYSETVEIMCKKCERILYSESK